MPPPADRCRDRAAKPSISGVPLGDVGTSPEIVSSAGKQVRRVPESREWRHLGPQPHSAEVLQINQRSLVDVYPR
jgi:hypothetical protein